MIFRPGLKTVSRYFDGALSEAKSRKIALYLKKCQSARRRVEIFEKMDAVLKPKRNLSADFAERVCANLPEVKRITQLTYAEIEAVKGYVRIYRGANDEGIEGFPGMALKKGDTLRLIGDSRALIELNDGGNIYLNKETEISLKTRFYNLTMQSGEIFAMMKPQKKAFEIKTPSAVLGVIGTDFDAKITEKEKTILQVLKGKVSFKNESGSAIVKKMHQVEATKYSRPTPTKIRETKSISNWTSSIRPKKNKGETIMKKLGLIILLLGIIVGGIFYFQKQQKPDKTFSPRHIVKLDKTDPLELVSPYTQEGLSWRIRAAGQIKRDDAWMDTGTIVTRSDIIHVDEENGSRVLLTIEDVKVPEEHPEEQLDKETADRMIGRQFEYLVSPEGKAHSTSIADGKPLKYMEISFYGMARSACDISGLFLKKSLIPGEQWTEQFEENIPGYPNSRVKGAATNQFVKYEIRDGVEYAVIRSHITGSVGGGLPIKKVVEPKAIHSVQLDQMSFETRWEYYIDVESGRLVSGMSTNKNSGSKVTITSIIQGRRVPIREKIEEDSGALTRSFITVEYLP